MNLACRSKNIEKIIFQDHFINFAMEFSLGQRLNTDNRAGNLIAVNGEVRALANQPVLPNKRPP